MQRITTFFLALIMLVTVAAPAWANGEDLYDDQLRAFFKGDPFAAFGQVRAQALKGDAHAQFKLGALYALQEPRDANRAVYWWMRAAERGHPRAKEWLQILARWDGYVWQYRDPKMAAYWLGKAAEPGNYRAMLTLSQMYTDGSGVLKDPAKAKYWLVRAVGQLKKAAQQGDAWAQSRLGFLYLNGQGVAQDKTQAWHWFNKATEKLRAAGSKGDAEAAYRLAMYYAGEEFGPDGFQVAPADRDKEMFWLTKAAEMGHRWAMYALGLRYIQTPPYNDYPLDEKKSAYWFAKADQLLFKEALKKAQQGDIAAQLKVARIYDDGEGVPEDDLKWLEWFGKAVKRLTKLAEQGDLAAQLKLAECYTSSNPYYDPEKRAYWLAKAAAQGSAEAQFQLAECYLRGRGVAKDPEKAVPWLTKAAEQGHYLAQSELSQIYRGGAGVGRDQAKAGFWLIKAAQSGDVDAKSGVARLYEQGQGMPLSLVTAYMYYDLASKDDESRKARDRVAQKMTSAQIAEAKRLIIEWIKQP